MSPSFTFCAKDRIHLFPLFMTLAKIAPENANHYVTKLLQDEYVACGKKTVVICSDDTSKKIQLWPSIKARESAKEIALYPGFEDLFETCIPDLKEPVKWCGQYSPYHACQHGHIVLQINLEGWTAGISNVSKESFECFLNLLSVPHDRLQRIIKSIFEHPWFDKTILCCYCYWRSDQPIKFQVYYNKDNE